MNRTYLTAHQCKFEISTANYFTWMYTYESVLHFHLSTMVFSHETVNTATMDPLVFLQLRYAVFFHYQLSIPGMGNFTAKFSTSERRFSILALIVWSSSSFALKSFSSGPQSCIASLVITRPEKRWHIIVKTVFSHILIWTIPFAGLVASSEIAFF